VALLRHARLEDRLAGRGLFEEIAERAHRLVALEQCAAIRHDRLRYGAAAIGVAPEASASPGFAARA
jgi:hypothetical protein